MQFLVSMHTLYSIHDPSDDVLQQTLTMLDMVPIYWIPMLNPIVTILTVKQYRFRITSIFKFGNRVGPVVPMVAKAGAIGENGLIRGGLRAAPIESLQTTFNLQQ